MNKKVISANSFPCPEGEGGALTIIVYEDGTILRRCSYGNCPKLQMGACKIMRGDTLRIFPV
jgi:hypothetical protein